jgi:acyl-coenzyme A synthetase/AMP-(fatty) acid ligase
MTTASAPGISHYYESILFQSRQDPGATAVAFGTTSITYAAFCRHIDNVTRRLQRCGLAAGTRLLVDVPHPYLHWLVSIAAGRAGLVAASADAFAGRNDLLALLGTGVIVTDRDAGLPPEASPLIADEGWWEDEADAPPAVVSARVAPDAFARIIFSSGTTGTPKKIGLSYRHCAELAKAQEFGLGARSRLLSLISVGTIGGFMYPVRTWTMGGTVVFQPAGASLCDVIVGNRLTHLYTSPVQLAMLVETLPRAFLPQPALTVLVAGGAIPLALNRRTCLQLTPSLFQIYGSTEARTVAYSHAGLADGDPAVVGYVVPEVDVDVLGADGSPLAPGNAGELRIRSPWCVTGYVDDDASAMFRDGWFYPGDIAVISTARELRIVGRTSELMNLGGQKIAPMRIEEALTPHPGMTDIAAFSLPDGQGIERPWVAVAVSAGFDQHALVARLRAHFPELPPLSVAVVPAIPRNAMGKVLRKELRERVAAALANPG